MPVAIVGAVIGAVAAPVLGMGVVAGALAGAGAGMQVESYLGQQEAAEQAASAQREQAAATREQLAAQQRASDIKNRREAAMAFRQARKARAIIAAQGANTGTSLSTGVVGGMSSVSTQASANQTVFNQLGMTNDEQTSAAERYSNATVALADANADATVFGTVGKLGEKAWDIGGGGTALSKWVNS